MMMSGSGIKRSTQKNYRLTNPNLIGCLLMVCTHETLQGIYTFPVLVIQKWIEATPF